MIIFVDFPFFPLKKARTTPQTKTTSSLFNSPNKVSPPLGFAERIEVASVIKTDSQDENYEEFFGAMSKTPSPE